MNTITHTPQPLNIKAGYSNTAGTLQVILATAKGNLFDNGTSYMGDKATEVAKFIRDARPNVGDVVHLPLPGRAKVCALIVAETQTAASIEALGEKVVKTANTKEYTSASLVLETFGLSAETVLEKVVYGAQMQANSFTLKSTAKAGTLTRLYLYKTDDMTNLAGVNELIDNATNLAMGSVLMRTLIQLPPNMLGTRQLFDVALGLKSINRGLKVTMTKITHASKLQAMYNVGKASSQDSILIEIRYEGDPNAPLTALVGKGLVFDTGGINLKPNGGTGMKGDMGGSALVLGTVMAAAARGEKVNLVAVIGAVCNDIGPDAYRPDDVITAYNGKTIEVTNTDAEGRMVLADCLSYTEEKYAPARIFSFATLTGAAVVATGRRAPIFSDDEGFAADVVAAAKAAGEMVTYVEMDDYLKPSMVSTIADLRNTSTGRMCGHTTAAIFLNHFVAGTPYVHVDIAGASDINGPGGGAFGVPMMVNYLANFATAK